MSDKSSSPSGGIGFTGALFLLFLGLKLTGNITWSWWWVTAPLWGVAALVVLVLMIALVVYLVRGERKETAAERVVRRMGGRQ